MEDGPKVIFLAPLCDHGEEGRMWCEDNVWDCKCGAVPPHKAIKYIRADAVTATTNIAQ